VKLKPSERYQWSEATPFKQYCARNAFALHLACTKRILIKHRDASWLSPKPPLYIDFNAGPGIDPVGSPGSPLIFLEEATKKEMTYEVHLYEADSETYTKLVTNLRGSGLNGGNIYLHPQSNSDISEIVPAVQEGWRYGLAYFDPSNAPAINELFPLASIVARKLPQVDLLFNYAAASYKRTVEHAEYRSLLDWMKTIDKRTGLIREPYSQFQWTMLILTNWTRYPEDEARNWYNIDSPEGESIFRRVNYTSKQLHEAAQLPLFGDLP
jgi:three-Cys-motif partner protein